MIHLEREIGELSEDIRESKKFLPERIVYVPKIIGRDNLIKYATALTEIAESSIYGFARALEWFTKGYFRKALLRKASQGVKMEFLAVSESKVIDNTNKINKTLLPAYKSLLKNPNIEIYILNTKSANPSDATRKVYDSFRYFIIDLSFFIHTDPIESPNKHANQGRFVYDPKIAEKIYKQLIKLYVVSGNFYDARNFLKC